MSGNVERGRNKTNLIDVGLYQKMYELMEDKGYLTYDELRKLTGRNGSTFAESVKNNFDSLGLFIYDSSLAVVDKKRFTCNVSFIPCIRPCKNRKGVWIA